MKKRSKLPLVTSRFIDHSRKTPVSKDNMITNMRTVTNNTSTFPIHSKHRRVCTVVDLKPYILHQLMHLQRALNRLYKNYDVKTSLKESVVCLAVH